MAMAMHSDRTNPSAPWKVGTFPRGLIFKYSGLTPLEGSSWTDSTSRPLAFATTRRAVVRGLF